MLNKYSFLYILLVLTGLAVFSAPAAAEMGIAAPVVMSAPADPAAAAEGPLTVLDIVIDKTEKNAVVARDNAIVEARRTAFRALAKRSMSPEAFQAWVLPPDETIAALVQDFEIKNEQISVNRYVASFTVRFNPEIADYIQIPEGATAIVAKDSAALPVVQTPQDPALATQAVLPAGSREVLVLPYFEDISGKKLLWEDPNPWRDAWQATGNSTPAVGLTITVPLGDLADVSSGSTEAVWSGDYSVIEKLRTNYNANEVALAVANKSGIYTRVDLYIYKDGRLERKKPVIPYAQMGDQDSFGRTIAKVISAIQSPEPFDTPIEPPMEGVFPPAPLPEIVTLPEPALPEKITLEATMGFDSFPQWLEVQRRLTAISPKLEVGISSLTKNAARFTITYDGSLPSFKIALAGQGLALSQPVVEVDPSVLGSDKPTQRPLYELRYAELLMPR